MTMSQDMYQQQAQFLAAKLDLPLATAVTMVQGNFQSCILIARAITRSQLETVNLSEALEACGLPPNAWKNPGSFRFNT